MPTFGLTHFNPLVYTGIPTNVVPLRPFPRRPLTTDIKYPVGQFVILKEDPSTGVQGELWYLSKFNSSGEAVWARLDIGADDFETITTPDAAVVVPSAGNVNFLNGTGMNITGSGSSVTFNALPQGLTWSEVTGTTQAMAVNNGYVANNAGLVTLTLPVTAAQFTTISVIGKGAGGWRIAQNAGQTIYFGSSTTTPGAGGSLSSSQQRDGVTLMCITANTEWQVMPSPQGNLTVV